MIVSLDLGDIKSERVEPERGEDEGGRDQPSPPGQASIVAV